MAKRTVVVKSPAEMQAVEARAWRPNAIRLRIAYELSNGTPEGTCLLDIPAARKLAQGINAICDGMEAK